MKNLSFLAVFLPLPAFLEVFYTRRIFQNETFTSILRKVLFITEKLYKIFLRLTSSEPVIDFFLKTARFSPVFAGLEIFSDRPDRIGLKFFHPFQL
jgi:hypothetical protein